MQRLQEAETNYYITSKHFIETISCIFDVFKSSEVERKQLIIKLILSNFSTTGEKIDFRAKKAFDLLVNCSERILWRD